MTFTRVSVLVPTRGRVPQLRRMLASFEASDSAELVFRVDHDDPDTLQFLAEAQQASPDWYVSFVEWGWPVVVGPRLNGYRSLPQFFEDMRTVATGDLFMCGNDDMVFRTPNWPELVLAEANRFPDGVFCLGVDTLNAGVFPFSIISRVAADAMGFIQDPRITCGDLFLRDVMAHFGRAIPLPGVRVDHEWGGFPHDYAFPDTAYWQVHKQAVSEAVSKLEVLYGAGQTHAG